VIQTICCLWRRVVKPCEYLVNNSLFGILEVPFLDPLLFRDNIQRPINPIFTTHVVSVAKVPSASKMECILVRETVLAMIKACPDILGDISGKKD
jgi:hypothetical protein